MILWYTFIHCYIDGENIAWSHHDIAVTINIASSVLELVWERPGNAWEEKRNNGSRMQRSWYQTELAVESSVFCGYNFESFLSSSSLTVWRLWKSQWTCKWGCSGVWVECARAGGLPRSVQVTWPTHSRIVHTAWSWLLFDFSSQPDFSVRPDESRILKHVQVLWMILVAILTTEHIMLNLEGKKVTLQRTQMYYCMLYWFARA